MKEIEVICIGHVNRASRDTHGIGLNKFTWINQLRVAGDVWIKIENEIPGE